MQRPSSPFDLRGTKIAFILLSMAANVALSLLFFSLMDWLMLQYGDQVTGIDTTLMLGIFLGSLLIGFLMSLFAKDGRGIAYGVYGGLAGLVVIVLMTWKSGLLAALVGLMAVLGGYNGGSLGEGYRRVQKKNRNVSRK